MARSANLAKLHEVRPQPHPVFDRRVISFDDGPSELSPGHHQGHLLGSSCLLAIARSKAQVPFVQGKCKCGAEGLVYQAEASDGAQQHLLLVRVSVCVPRLPRYVLIQ